MFFRFLALLSAAFLCWTPSTVLYGASSSDSSSNPPQTISYTKCNHDVTAMYFFKHDNFSKDGSWLFFKTNNENHLYNTVQDQIQKNALLRQDNIEKCPQITSLAGYEPLTKGRGICFTTVYLKKHKAIQDINDDNFSPNTPKFLWPSIVKKRFAHNGIIKNAFFSNDKQYLIAQSDKMITITPIDKQSKYTLTPKNLDGTNFKHIALSPNNKLAICTQANKIYFINLEQCKFIKDIKTEPQYTQLLKENLALKEQLAKQASFQKQIKQISKQIKLAHTKIEQLQTNTNLITQNEQEPILNNQTQIDNNVPKKKKWWNKIIDNPWKSFAIAQSVLIATAITGFALYKWKPNWVKKCFSKFKWSF